MLLCSKSFAEKYYFKECIISNNVKGDYIINIKKNIIEVQIKLADGKKCERCWAVLQEVLSSKNNLCNRCDDVWKTFQQ